MEPKLVDVLGKVSKRITKEMGEIPYGDGEARWRALHGLEASLRLAIVEELRSQKKCRHHAADCGVDFSGGECSESCA